MNNNEKILKTATEQIANVEAIRGELQAAIDGDLLGKSVAELAKLTMLWINSPHLMVAATPAEEIGAMVACFYASQVARHAEATAMEAAEAARGDRG